MTDLIDKPKFSRRTGMTHGVRAFVDGNRLPSGRAYRRAMKEVSLIRDRLVAKYGGDKIEPNVLVKTGSAAKSMMAQKLCVLYIKKSGILRRDSLDQGNLELHSVLAKSFASYSNLTRLSLKAAARLAGQAPIGANVPDVLTYIASYDTAKEAQEAKASPEPSQDERSPPGQGSEAENLGRDDKKKETNMLQTERRLKALAALEAEAIEADGRPS